MTELFDLTDKTAIVTGASRGIGEAIARRMAQHGARVVISSRNLDACAAIAQSINDVEAREAAIPLACNISHADQLDRLCDKTVKAFGGIDILAVNAAVNTHYGPSAEIDDAAFDKIFACNVKASHRLGHVAAASMRARGGGAMIFVASIAGRVGTATIGPYGVSKAAMIQVARNLAVEYGPAGIRANAICPGIVKTAFAEALWTDETVTRDVETRTPLRRFGAPDDVAGAAVFLASPAGAWTTGQALVVDGGATMAPMTL
ncbi:MAG: SDR family oxidoreductase [Pseudomonadota bacterium]